MQRYDGISLSDLRNERFKVISYDQVPLSERYELELQLLAYQEALKDPQQWVATIDVLLEQPRDAIRVHVFHSLPELVPTLANALARSGESATVSRCIRLACELAAVAPDCFERDEFAVW